MTGVGVSGSDFEGVLGCFFDSGRPVGAPPSSVRVSVSRKVIDRTFTALFKV